MASFRSANQHTSCFSKALDDRRLSARGSHRPFCGPDHLRGDTLNVDQRPANGWIRIVAWCGAIHSDCRVDWFARRDTVVDCVHRSPLSEEIPNLVDGLGSHLSFTSVRLITFRSL